MATQQAYWNSEVEGSGNVVPFQKHYHIAKPLDLEKTYKVAGSSYTLLSKGDGQTAFEGCTVLEEGNRIDNAVLIDYITQKLNGQIGADYADPYGQGRITIVEEAQ